MHRLAAIGPTLLVACTIVSRYETPEEECHNGIDDDADGFEDCRDPECACEDLEPYCANGMDDDRDGLADAEEPICWPWSLVTSRLDVTGPPDRTESRTCSSGLRTSLALEVPGDFRWSGGVLPSGGVTLGGGEDCAGLGLVSETCQYLHAVRPLSGGGCWSVAVDFELPDVDAESELAVVLASGLDPERPPLGAAEAVVLGVRRRVEQDVDLREVGVPRLGRGAMLELRYSARGGAVVVAAASSAERHLALRVDTGPKCDPEQARIQLAAAGGGTPLLELMGPDVTFPEDWSRTALLLGLQAAAPAPVRVDAISAGRAQHDPCGFALPQITADQPGEAGPWATVLAAARGDGWICAIGSTPTGPLVERVYRPHDQHASPPVLPPDDPELSSQPFAAWRSEDDGIDSFSGQSVDGPYEALNTAADEPPANIRSAALAWDPEAGQFEAVLLRSNDPRAGGTLARAWSPDCATWTIEPLVSLDHLGSLHPVLLELGANPPRRRLVLAEPGGAYAYDPPCDDVPAFRAPQDAVPQIKPATSDCDERYPRARLVEATSDGGDEWGVTDLGELPAFDRWQIACACTNNRGELLPDRRWPAGVSQLIDQGGYRAFVASGHVGIEVVLDAQPEAGESTLKIADGRTLAAPLLAPSGVPGTFDAAAVRDGVLLLFDAVPGSQARSGLVFYRGFEAVEVSEQDERVRYRGGTVGVVPVRFERPETGAQ